MHTCCTLLALSCSKAEPDALLASQNAALQDEVQHLRHLLTIAEVSASQIPGKQTAGNLSSDQVVSASITHHHTARQSVAATTQQNCLPSRHCEAISSALLSCHVLCISRSSTHIPSAAAITCCVCSAAAAACAL